MVIQGISTHLISVTRVKVWTSTDISCGYAAIKRFSVIMAKRAYDKISLIVNKAVKTVAEKPMSDAAKELNDSYSTIDTGVSVDGTWQKRGHLPQWCSYCDCNKN